MVPGRRVLVMGSWLGAEAIAYALCGAEVTAIDLDGEALRLSAELAARYGTSIQTATMDAAATTLPAGHFDLVSCSQVLEHLPPDRQPALLAEMWRLVPAGRTALVGHAESARASAISTTRACISSTGCRGR